MLPAETCDATIDPEHALHRGSGKVLSGGCSLESIKTFAEAEKIATTKTHPMYGWQRMKGLECAQKACQWRVQKQMQCGNNWRPRTHFDRYCGDSFSTCIEDFRESNNLPLCGVSTPISIDLLNVEFSDLNQE